MAIQIAMSPPLAVIILHAYIWLVSTNNELVVLHILFVCLVLEYLANEEGPSELDRIEEELKLLEQKENDLIQKKSQSLTTQSTDKGMSRL